MTNEWLDNWLVSSFHVFEAFVDVVNWTLLGHERVQIHFFVQILFNQLGNTVHRLPVYNSLLKSWRTSNWRPNAVPFQLLPFTRFFGAVEISSPFPATPIITETPHPLWQDSNACRWKWIFPRTTGIYHCGGLTDSLESVIEAIVEQFTKYVLKLLAFWELFRVDKVRSSEFPSWK